MSLMRRTIAACSFFPFSSRKRSRVGEWSKWSSMEFFPVPVTMMMCSIPETTHSYTTFCGGLIRFVAIAATSLLPAVVRHVPARAFELNRRRGDYRFHFAAAVRAFFQVRPGNVFNFVCVTAALQAFVLVQGH